MRENLKTVLALCLFVFIGLGFMVLDTYRMTGRWVSSPTLARRSDDGAKEILPIEDLMREHGVLNRLLLIYEELIRRAEEKEHFPKGVLIKVLALVRTFIEDYHEKLEETYIFPLFEKHAIERDLVKTLISQHVAGRGITDELQKLVKDAKPAIESMVYLMKEFIRMYRPHEAREDTELFPKIHDLITAEELKELGEKFEEREEQLFGKHGFERVVDKVATLEKELDIYQLDQFTPKPG